MSGFETYKTVLCGKENKLTTVAKIGFSTNAANKSSVYFYDRGMKQVVILG
ncbi:MAG: hypothetical protein ACLUQJ_06605 [Alphaproteobacteria bacterium]